MPSPSSADRASSSHPTPGSTAPHYPSGRSYTGHNGTGYHPSPPSHNPLHHHGYPGVTPGGSHTYNGPNRKLDEPPHTPFLPVSHPVTPEVAASARRGREGYWRAVQAAQGEGDASTILGFGAELEDTITATNPESQMPSMPVGPGSRDVMNGPMDGAAKAGGSGISLVFRRPNNGAQVETPRSQSKGRESRGSPSSVASSSGKRKRKVLEVAPNPGRASRSRASSPVTSAIDTPPPTGPQSAAARSSAQTSAAFSDSPSKLDTAATGIPPSLHIFAPPPDSALPQALQEVIGSSSSSRRSEAGPSTTTKKDIDGDVLMREAGEGFEARRSARSKPPPATAESTVRAGVSARGTGVKVGNLPKDSERRVIKKKTGKLDTPNQDFCSACRGVGKFLCCDGCPRSFHFMCLEPPLRVDELPEEETWYCKKCQAERTRERSPSPKDKDPRPIPLTFKNMIKRADEENPTAFRLPQDIRQFFAGVNTDSRGYYIDQEETRTKYDRKGFQEERDGTRLRDGRSKPVACYVCGGSSIPLRSHTTDPESTWRQIVSCDYCALHWHLDCLSPPLASMPNSGRKWMCPNHADQVMARRRTIRSGLETVDIESRGAANNGNIVVVPDEDNRPPLEYEDLVINRKKYRVPEKIIRLDFWDKLGLGKGKRVAPAKGGDGVFKHKRSNSASSETSLPTDPPELDFEPTADDLHAAHLVLALTQPLVEEPNTQHTPSTSIIPATGTAAPSSDRIEIDGPSSRAETLDTSTTNTLNGVVDADMATTPPTGSPAPRRDTGTPKITLRLGRRNE